MTVRLTDADPSATVFLHVGDRLRVELPNSPFAGLRWALSTLDASHLEVLSKRDRPLASGFFAPSEEVFVWKAISAGHADIGLELARRGGDDLTVPPAKRMMIAVEIAPDELTPRGAKGGDPLDSAFQATATYRGTLPCGDCLGIAVELTLCVDSFAVKSKATKSSALESRVPLSPTAEKTDPPDADMVFVERRRYQGAPGGDRTIAGTGKLIVRHGTYADPSMTVYVLAAADGSVENFKVESDRLVPLDGQMLPVGSPPGKSIGLDKVADPASGP